MLENKIKNLLPDVIEKKFNQGDFIFRENEKDSNFYFILKGDVEISKLTSGGQEKVIAELEKGEFLGEGILSGDEKKPASAKAMNEVILLVLDHQVFQKYISEDPKKMIEFLLLVLDSTSDRLTSTNAKLLAIYEINQIISMYRDDLKLLALHLIQNLTLLTDSKGGVFMTKNPFSETYQVIYSSIEAFKPSIFKSSQLAQTQVIDYNGEKGLILSIEEAGSILMVKSGEYDDDQIRVLSLMSEQIATALKDVSQKASDKAKKILESKHFDL